MAGDLDENHLALEEDSLPEQAIQLIKDCIRQRAPVIRDRAESDASGALPASSGGWEQSLAVPVLQSSQVVAVMVLEGKSTPYIGDDIEYAVELADITMAVLERQRAEERVEFMAYYDTLTGLPNRVLFSDRLHQAMAASQRNNKMLAVCYMDLDGFKPVNDQYGHHVGDLLLASFAKRLQELLRASDTIARLGGDEFALLLTEIKSSRELSDILNRLLDSIHVAFLIDSHRIHISCSIGVTLFPQDDVDADTLLRHADQAMFEVKAAGKAGFKLYEPAQDIYTRQRELILQEFGVALQEEQLELHFQPKIDLRNGQLLGFESLIRWNHPMQGLLYPNSFLPMIENTPMEFALGEWVLVAALKQMQQWHNRGHRFEVSINVSSRHIQQDDFATHLFEVLDSFPKELSLLLQLEVLEMAAFKNLDEAAKVMQSCRERNIHFSLDDFGTGYASLTYLHSLPIDVLKIDQNFVSIMLHDARSMEIVKGVLQIAENVNIPVVAEGVESVEIGLMLLHMGCSFAQGYGIARPMPANAIEPWIEKWEEESLWKQLHQETTGRTDCFDLNVAIFSHQLWLKQIEQYIDDPDSHPLPILDEELCQFVQWYKGLGYKRYGEHPSYPFVEVRHHKVHETARKLERFLKQDSHEKSVQTFETLSKYSEQFISLLKELVPKEAQEL